jgi:hypothetical protein
MRRHNQNGSLEVFGAVVILLLIGAFFFAVLFVRFKTSNERVSGIVYNTQNDRLISGKTTFSVRASENTVVTEENASNYCLPKGSKYIALVNRAAEDKRIKVVVTSGKYVAVQLPWSCNSNVVVTEVK